MQGGIPIYFNFLKKPVPEETIEKLKINIYNTNFENESFRFLYKNLQQIDPGLERPLLYFCIGTDRSTGDCLGPLVGHFLQRRQPHCEMVFGTLENPVHALNLKDKLAFIKETFHDPLIIAVDACLGRTDSVGNVTYNLGPLKPGAAVNKNLPEVGDLSISAIVNIGGFMEHLVLQNTRLSIVLTMAEKIAKVLYWVNIKKG